ncbi:hypothetical protein [Sphingobium yanoikuyae]|uniref:Uncharacterized protein n=2 Tax=Sphingobium yanoikuyae TaxID=13690 RepID=K9D6N1_SPHYA|nr:hypothetical protein [Sphingobium yanoikuyae]EKU74617.1 hypothetical protein HMPREF9718_02145 [Sphingobium yanoikuyae ATCC 51230]
MSDDHWDSMSVEFRLTNASVVAMFENCSAISEIGLSLTVQEGRLLTFYGLPDDDDGDDDATTLEYKCIITATGSNSEKVESREARINVDGTHDNGRRLTIKGHGWAGRDQDGLLELLFDEPPTMVVYDYPIEFEDGGDERVHKDNVVALNRPGGSRGGE